MVLHELIALLEEAKVVSSTGYIGVQIKNAAGNYKLFDVALHKGESGVEGDDDAVVFVELGPTRSPSASLEED